MILKEKVETKIREAKSGLKPEKLEKNFITFCNYVDKNCKVICSVADCKKTEVVAEEDIPCTAKEYKEFAKECKKDREWEVHKLFFWTDAYCFRYD